MIVSENSNSTPNLLYFYFRCALRNGSSLVKTDWYYKQGMDTQS